MEELILTKQFLLGLPDDLRIWLRERKPESLHQVATLADDYVLVHKSDKRFSSGRPAPSSVNNVRQQEEPVSGQGQFPRGWPVNSASHNGRSQTNTRGDKKCF